MGVVGVSIAGVIVGINVDGEDALFAFLGLGLAAFVLILVAGLGLVTLFLSYKAWGMARFWVWALILFSILSIPIEPWAIIAAVLTIIGGMQVLEQQREAMAKAT